MGRPRECHPGERLFDLDSFARRIRVRMAERNIKQADVVIEARVSKATLSRICRASLCPDVETYMRLVRWLDAPSPGREG
jgi:transcriptional regulator with XRE-family HTH domain